MSQIDGVYKVYWTDTHVGDIENPRWDDFPRANRRQEKPDDFVEIAPEKMNVDTSNVLRLCREELRIASYFSAKHSTVRER